MASRRTAAYLLSSTPARATPRASTSFLPKFSALRNMASSAPRKGEWLVIIPDFPGVLEKRFSVRPKHFEGMKSLFDSGAWRMGGPLLDEVPKDDDPSSLKINGSVIVAFSSSKEEIMEILKGDAYTKAGVWDLEKVQMWPMKTMVSNL